MRIRSLPTVLSLVLACPLAAQAPVRFELSNGLRVWIQEDHRRPVVLVQTAYKFGAINESPGTTGTAHYIEHMVYRATQNVRNEDQYGYNDRIGGRWTGGTSSLGTTYGETVPSWALESALRVTAERMGGRALFDSLEFERERNNVVTEANGFSRIDPATALRDAVMLTSFEVHPYRYSSNTWARDNLDITRDDAFNLYKRYYGPNNAVLVVVGDVTIADARRLIEKHFAPLPRAPESAAVRVVEPPQRAEKRVALSYNGTRQQLDMVYRAPQAAHADYPVLAVFDRLLMARLRPIAMAMRVTDLASSHNATPYPSVYRFTATSEPTVSLDSLVRVIQNEIDRLMTAPISAEELAAARVEPPQPAGGRGGRGGGANQNANASGRQTINQIASALTAREVFPWEVSPQLRDAIRQAQTRVTAEQIRAYAARWLRPSQRTVGFLLAGGDNFVPIWSDGRAIVGQRLEVPPMKVQPAKRMTPEPVPPQALEPLAPLALKLDRRVLTNGAVLRAVQTTDSAAVLAVRVRVGVDADPPGKQGLAAFVANVIASDPLLATARADVATGSLANDGFFDLTLPTTPAALGQLATGVANALRKTSYTQAQLDGVRAAGVSAGGRGGRGGRGGGAGGGGGGRGTPATDSRTRVLAAVAPAWRSGDGTTPESWARITAADVNAFITRRISGATVVVAVASPRTTAVSLSGIAPPFNALRKGQPPAAMRPASFLPRADEERISAASETQVTVLAGLPGVPRTHPDYRALALLNYIAGAPFYGGRLGWALTKAGLTYSSTATTTGGASTGFITLSTECDTRNLESTIQAIREVVESIAERGVEEWELKEAKGFTLGRMLLSGPREDAGDAALASALLESETTGDEQLDLPAFSRAYLGVTLAQVNAAAKKYYRPELLKVVAIGAIPTGTPDRIFAPGTFKALFNN